MPVYDFTFGSPQPIPPEKEATSTSQGRVEEQHPVRTPDLHPKKIDVDEASNKAPEEVREVITRGFHVVDEGMKNWLSGIKVPIADNYKVASVHIVNQDRSILSWAQDFFDGRVPLPVIAVKRDSWSFDSQRYHPPFHPYIRQYTDDSKRRMRMIYKPIPFTIEYSISIWGEYKQDAEYINTNILKRSSPQGIFYVQDEIMQQIVRVVHNSSNDNSDIDIAKDRAKVMYDMSMTAEYAIPINEKIVPTVLGRVVSIKEMDTREPFEVYRVEDFQQ
jgi:hypothetical protein